ncbi:hypothetical protein VR46_32795, partial [Streptomyces sp. NRRL S-444]
MRTGTAGKARPSSSAVRRAPTTWARSRNDPHSSQCQALSCRPHQPQCRSRASGASSGPAHTLQRAGVRQRSHASLG